jgi:hypothetical protein
MEYRYGRHTIFQIEYHFVWVTKYQYKVLNGEVAERVRELVRETCEVFEIRIVKNDRGDDQAIFGASLWSPGRTMISKWNPIKTRRLVDAYPDFQSATLTHQLSCWLLSPAFKFARREGVQIYLDV